MKNDFKVINENKEFEFVKYIKKLFRYLGYEIEYIHHSSYFSDFVISNKNFKFDVDIKYSKKINNDMLNKIIKSASHYNNGTLIIVTPSYIQGRHTQTLVVSSETIIIDIVDLLYIVQDHDEMKNELLNFIDFNIDRIELKESDSIRRLCIKKLAPVEIPYDNYIKSLEDWKNTTGNRKKAGEYEALCTEVLKVLFSDDLTLWEKQKSSNKNLYRFDLVCRIKDNILTGFWNLLENRFNSKYVIFEYKNYSKKISQKEIYTTEKYLYLKALRSVAFIISRTGTSANADTAIRGCLRENGKLIISLTNDDLITMLEKKSNGYDPSEYLYDILDSMLLSLEK